MTDQPHAMTDTLSGEDPRIVRARQEVHWALTIDEHKALINDLLVVVTELQAERDRILKWADIQNAEVTRLDALMRDREA